MMLRKAQHGGKILTVTQVESRTQNCFGMVLEDWKLFGAVTFYAMSTRTMKRR